MPLTSLNFEKMSRVQLPITKIQSTCSFSLFFPLIYIYIYILIWDFDLEPILTCICRRNSFVVKSRSSLPIISICYRPCQWRLSMATSQRNQMRMACSTLIQARWIECTICLLKRGWLDHDTLSPYVFCKSKFCNFGLESDTVCSSNRCMIFCLLES